ncbi:lipopolysaccharide A protein [Vibrio sp. SM6]|uniref:Lipopolysaccharide A protein n=1 Tax=Vibrio agarilyticus TaxID=2726741 RepID=A0A7X8TRC6_9VIBR|nr:glycosyl transferase family 90 [Vibrio agarilyticus]NLS13572.1 lipopolysaccharide A protein [Vibrio agarilyticus]
MQNSKFSYYFKNTIAQLTPNFIYRWHGKRQFERLNEQDKQHVESRLAYYNKVTHFFTPNANEAQYSTVAQFKKTKGWTYFFDLKAVIRQFAPNMAFNYLNGDIRHVPATPTFVKSRPIGGNNQNSVLLKLNKIRHFQFVNDTMPYQQKKESVVWRGVGHQPHRKVVIHSYYQHPRCNIGQSKPQTGEPWFKGFLSIEEQLKYKFLLAIEGNDVATNLKWAMSANSVVMMSKPRYETWFMEGKLQAGVHYVELKDDYSDLIEKMDYYLAHEQEALAIINNAHAWVAQFQQPHIERALSFLVAEKYFAHQLHASDELTPQVLL